LKLNELSELFLRGKISASPGHIDGRSTALKRAIIRPQIHEGIVKRGEDPNQAFFAPLDCFLPKFLLKIVVRQMRRSCKKMK